MFVNHIMDHNNYGGGWDGSEISPGSILGGSLAMNVFHQSKILLSHPANKRLCCISRESGSRRVLKLMTKNVGGRVIN